MEIKIFRDKDVITKSFRDRGGISSQFYPLDSISQLTGTEKKSVQDDKILTFMFNTVPELSSPILYAANVGSKIPYKTVTYNDKGEEKEIIISDVDKLMNNPNPFDNRVNFMRRVLINFWLFGNNYTNIYKGKYSLRVASRLYLLPPKYVSLVFEKMEYNKVDPNADFRTNMITDFLLEYGDTFKKLIPFDEVSHFKDSQVNFDNGAYAKGQSRAYTAIMAIETTKEAYEAAFVIYKNRGMFGLIVNDDPDAIQFEPEQEKKLLDKFKTKFGLHKDQNLIQYVNKNLKYIKIDMDFASLKINENNKANFYTICKVLNFPATLLDNERTSLLRNGKEKETELIKNMVAPAIDDYYQMLSIDLGLAKENKWIVADYSNVEALLEDSDKTVKRNKTSSDGISQVLSDFNNGVLSDVQALYLLVDKWGIEETEAKKLLVKPEKIEENEEEV